MAAEQGRDDSPIRSSVARAVMTPLTGENALGLGVQTRQDQTRLIKSGLNQGFICNFMAFPERGDVIVTMTNSRKGFPMVGDVNRTANQAYDWPSSPLIVHKRASVTHEELNPLSGAYAQRGETEIAFTLKPTDRVLMGTTPSGYQFELIKIEENTFVDPADAEIATLSSNETGRLTLTSGGTDYIRIQTIE